MTLIHEKEVTIEGKKPTVLIVDNEEATRDLVFEELAYAGYQCDVASDASDALAKLRQQTFDLALLDIKLPGMSGMDLLRTVQQCHHMTAVVMITGLNDVGAAVEAMRLGASDYIIKPFTLDKLNYSIIRALCDRKRKQHLAVYPIVSGTGDATCDDASVSEIDAIAYGVDAWVDHCDFHSRIVTAKTVELACSFGVPRREIKKWAAARDNLYSERDERIKSMLSRLERSPMAQAVLGLTRAACDVPESSQK